MIHFIKYNLIGLINTAITILIVWILYEQLYWNLELSNFLAFVGGALNSYFANRIWNFKSKNPKRSETLRFIIVFAIAYALNFFALQIAVYSLNTPTFFSINLCLSRFAKPGFFAHLFANFVYIITSFSLYKHWVFNSKIKTKN